MSIEQVWKLLDQREKQRLIWSRLSSRVPAPETVYYSVTNSLKHRRSNRYADILAYDRTALVVEGDYLNANVVKDGRGGRWIASQAPPVEAMPHFFKALHRARSAVLVQLTGWKERNMSKADPYMPSAGQTLSYLTPAGESIAVHAGSTTYSDELESHKTILTISSDRVGSTTQVTHFYYAGWPDHGVPNAEARHALRRLISTTEEYRAKGEEVWVHCSAGVGRTGTYIALSSLTKPGDVAPLSATPSGPLPESLRSDRVAVTVDNIRERRAMLVQNIEQFKLIYDMQSQA